MWKEAVVTENAMTRVIAQVRKALGDLSKQAKYDLDKRLEQKSSVAIEKALALDPILLLR